MKNYNLKINDNEYKVQLDKLDHTSKTARVIVNGTESVSYTHLTLPTILLV